MNYTKEELDTMPVPEGKVVFLGSNPSCSSPYHDPFSHCKSATKILNEWIPALGLTRDQVHFVNVANYKTLRNRPLKKSEIKAEISRLTQLLTGQVVVTLGKTAQQAMNLVLDGYDSAFCNDLTPCPIVLNLPHPSGLNRQLNNREWVRETLEKARATIDEWMNLPDRSRPDTYHP